MSAPVERQATSAAQEERSSSGGSRRQDESFLRTASCARRILKCGVSSINLLDEIAEQGPKSSGGPSSSAGLGGKEGAIKPSKAKSLVQAKFAARMAQKMQHRRQDRVTIRKDRVLAGVAMSGIGLMIVDALLLLHAPHIYPWAGPSLRALISLNCLCLVTLLFDYYRMLFARKRSDYPPSMKHFWHVPELQGRFVGEALIALIHPPPTSFPAQVPRPGECRLSGYGDTPRQVRRRQGERERELPAPPRAPARG